MDGLFWVHHPLSLEGHERDSSNGVLGKDLAPGRCRHGLVPDPAGWDHMSDGIRPEHYPMGDCDRHLAPVVISGLGASVR